MKKLSFILFLSTIISCSAVSQEITQPNGLWWKWAGNSPAHTNQVSFLVGFVDGINLGAQISLMSFQPNSKCWKTGLESFDQTNILDTIMVLTIQDQMTKFYRDTLNLHVSCYHAFWISALQISQKREEYINKLIELYRKRDWLEINENN